MHVEKILRVFLNLLGAYLICDGAIHLFNIRLASVINVWPQSALSYATLLNTIYASFVFLAAFLIFTVQKDLRKYKTLIYVSSFWALIHGSLLIYLSSTQNFVGDFSPFPSLLVWIPFYNNYLLFEAFLALVYSLLVYLWFRGRRSF